MDSTMASSKEIQATSQPSVSSMFQDRSIFITGASGFIGRVLLEKLIRCYPGIKRIYILMRAKKNQQPYERLHKQLLNVPIFDQIRAMENGTELLNKIVVIPGDIAEPQLGISDSDMQRMVDDESLSVVFHSAATIKFDEPLKVSVTLNLIATKSIITLCKRLPNLISLCHVSTAYVNSDIKDNSDIEEKLYPIRDDPDKLMKLANLMDESLLQELKVKLVANRPNTYTYTKALAEHMIAQEASDLPVAIVRPSIVIGSWKEPIKGWIDNLNGPTGLILAIGKGLLRSMHAKRTSKADLVPVDIVINTMIASAYYAAKINGKLSPSSQDANQISLSVNSLMNTTGQLSDGNEIDLIKCKQIKKETSNSVANMMTSNEIENMGSIKEESKCKLLQDERRDVRKEQGKRSIPIVHCNSGDLNPLTWGGIEKNMFSIIREYPSCQVLRYPFGTFKSNKYHDIIARIFVHYLPALIIDLICGLLGKKRQLLNVYYKLSCAVEALAHFTNQNYNFKSKNMSLIRSSLNDHDKRELYMDVENLVWTNFWHDYVLGARRYVLKEEDHTLEQARKSFRRAYYIEIALRTLLVIIGAVVALPLLRHFNVAYPIQSALHSLQVCL